MKAMVIKKYGSPDVFEMVETETPSIGQDDLLLKVRGSSVNPVDCALRQGLLKSFIRLRMPAILGVDVSGEVVKRGAAVSGFKPGDRVYAYTGLNRGGGYGEYAVVPSFSAAHVPMSLGIFEAGVVPGVGMTAYEAFTIHAPIKAGMHVLINGAGGGVGTYAVQVAKALGAQVTAVCSAGKINLVKSLGADEVINYREQNVLQLATRFDVVLNCVRGKGQLKFKALLNPGGKLVIIAGDFLLAPLIKLSNLFSSRKAIMFFVATDGEILKGLSEMIAAGKVKPVIEKMYNFRDLADAHRHCEAGGVTGKIGVKTG